MKKRRWASLTALTDCSGCSQPGVDLQGGVDLVVERPRQPGPVPAGVERDLGEHPVPPVGDGAEVVGVRRDPLRGALEDRHPLGAPGDGRDDLHGAGPGPDDGDPLPGDVEVVGPVHRVEQRAVEVVEAGQVGDLRAVELADRGDDDGGGAGLAVPVPVAADDGPAAGVVVPGHRLDLDAEADVAAQVLGVGDVAEVVEHLVALAEVRRPGLRTERVGVQVAGGVDAGAGIAVLPPRPADLVVALEGDDRHPHRAQRAHGEQPADAGADHERVEPLGDRGGRGGLLDRGGADRLGHHRLVLVGDVPRR